MTNNARDDARAVAGAKNRPYPHYLERVELLLDEVMFRLWVDFEPADRAVGVMPLRGLSTPTWATARRT
jgi:hypothetical protein